MLTLYFAPGSSFMAPRIALHEIGTAFKAMPISFPGARIHLFRLYWRLAN